MDDTLDGWPEINGGKRSLGNGSSIAMVAKMSGGFFSLDANEKQDLIVDANGLSDEVFGFDESLEGTETPYGGQIGEELDNAVIAKNTKKDVVPETQNFKLVSGHYGYYLPMNPTTTTLIQTADVEVEADITCSKQKEEEVEVIQVFDTSVISDTE